MQTTDDAQLTDVFSTDRDRGSNAAPPAAQAPEPAPSTPPAPPATDGKQTPDAAAPEAEEPSYEGVDPTGRMVPLAEMLGTRRKYKGKFEEADRQRQTLQAQLDALQKQHQETVSLLRQPQPAQPQQLPPQQEETPPDPYLDPVGYADWREAKLQQRQETQRLNLDYNVACVKVGDEAVNAAITAAQQMGRGFLGRFASRPQPHLDLVKWHKQHLAQQEISSVGDIEAFKKKVADDAVAAALANLQNGGTPPPAAQQQAPKAPQQVFPGSLSHVSASAPPAQNEAALESIFDTNRKRRA